MTLFKPTLQVRNLLVFQGGHKALDCAFHPGVNVVRGKNSSGKTTVMDLLAFSLGAEQIRWKPEALLCTHTVVEVVLNNEIATLRRQIGEEQQRPMEVFWGEVDDALEAPSHSWHRFPFKRTANLMSFSQVLLQSLEMPQAQGDGASNLTMHQLLRVLYADQPSVHSPIFRFDKWDSTLTRETIGGYLCGVYDDELYSAQLRARDIDASLTRLIAELKSILNILGQTGNTPDLDLQNYRIPELEKRRDELAAELLEYKASGNQQSTRVDPSTEGVRKELAASRAKYAAAVEKLQNVELEIADSRLFVDEVRRRLDSLDDSAQARAQLSEVEFQFCPCCLAELASSPNSGGCHLCKAEVQVDSGGTTQFLRMRNELSLQLKESMTLLERRAVVADELRRDLPLLSEEVRKIELQYEGQTRSAPTENERAIEQAARQLGAIDEEIKYAIKLQRLSEAVSDIRRRRNAQSEELQMLNDKIQLLELKQAGRKEEVSNHIEAAMVRLLHQDLPRQPEFVNASSADVSFVDNTVLVNGSRNFSESSAVVLRHVFHLALLTASTELEYMRVPRFIMLDGIDDGGMEKERSHQLQDIIVGECSNYNVDFQLIYATSEIKPEFEDTDLVVSRFFTPKSRSLDVEVVASNA